MTSSAGWRGEGLRVTLFTNEPLHENAWREPTGGEPEASNRNPRAGIAVEYGPYEDVWLTLQSAPERLDLSLTATPTETMLGEPTTWPPHIGALDIRLAQIRALAMRLCSRFVAIARLALGAAFLHKVNDYPAGVEWLQPYLPNVRLDREGYDLLYRVNRQRRFDLGKAEAPLLIHRVMTFSMVNVVTMMVDTQLAASANKSASHHACRLEIDLSTDQNRGVDLPRELCEVLLANFGDMASEIATKGDVP